MCGWHFNGSNFTRCFAPAGCWRCSPAQAHLDELRPGLCNGRARAPPAAPQIPRSCQPGGGALAPCRCLRRRGAGGGGGLPSQPRSVCLCPPPSPPGGSMPLHRHAPGPRPFTCRLRRGPPACLSARLPLGLHQLGDAKTACRAPDARLPAYLHSSTSLEREAGQLPPSCPRIGCGKAPGRRGWGSGCQSVSSEGPEKGRAKSRRAHEDEDGRAKWGPRTHPARRAPSVLAPLQPQPRSQPG